MGPVLAVLVLRFIGVRLAGWIWSLDSQRVNARRGNRFRILPTTFSSGSLVKRQAIYSVLLILASCLTGFGQDAPSAPGREFQVQLPDAIANPKNARELAVLRKFYDQTVWKDERLAEQYEKWIVRLWDAFLQTEDKWEVIDKRQIGEFIVGEPKAGEQLDWNIATTVFAGGRALGPEAWRKLARQLKDAGYQIIETEWHHSEFIPSRGEGDPARSVVSMVMHITHKHRDTRYIVRGDIKITWSDEMSGSRPMYTPVSIDTTDLVVLQRDGVPAFEEQAVREYELDPSGRSTATSIHPVLVHDLNGDRLPEVVVGGHNKVYWNRGNWEFEEAQFCDFPSRYVNAGVLADFTGDGVTDYLCGVKLGHLKLYVGSPGGRFLAVPRELKIASKPLTIPVSMTAGDIDGDGDLDVFVGQNKTGYQTGEIPSPYYDANDSYPSFLLQNDGKGNFTDVTAVAGLGEKRNRRNFGSSLVDLNADGHLDLLLTNDFCGNDLYLNDGQGGFRDVTDQLVPRSVSHGMSHTFGDFDLNGQLDFITIGMSSTTARRLDKLQLGRPDLPEHNAQRKHMGYGNRMYLSGSDGFRQAPFNADVARTGWSWGSTTLDFDRDGDPDLYIANGQTSGRTTQDYCTQYWCHDLYISNKKELKPALQDFFSKLAPIFNGHHMSWNGYEHNALLMNLDGKRFVNVGFLMNCGSEFDSRTAACADLDLDGRVDLIFEHISVRDAKSYLHFLRNQWGDEHHWLGIHLESDHPNVSPLGAKVVVKTNERTFVQHLVTGHSVWAQHPNTIHFGLGSSKEVQSLSVIWPDGHTTTKTNPQVDGYLVVTRPAP